jgi:hypothetical protein
MTIIRPFDLTFLLDVEDLLRSLGTPLTSRAGEDVLRSNTESLSTESTQAVSLLLNCIVNPHSIIQPIARESLLCHSVFLITDHSPGGAATTRTCFD